MFNALPPKLMGLVGAGAGAAAAAASESEIVLIKENEVALQSAPWID